jgi:hypothetical protein
MIVMNSSLRKRIADALHTAAPPAVIAVIALVILVLLRFPPGQYNFYPQCPIHELTHLQCPGCGATRAAAALFRGRLAEAMRLNALVTLLLPFVAGWGIVCYRRVLQRKPIRWPQPSPAVLYAAFTLTAVFTVIRNLPRHSF